MCPSEPEEVIAGEHLERTGRSVLSKCIRAECVHADEDAQAFRRSRSTMAINTSRCSRPVTSCRRLASTI